jgi:hypothetical protein
MTAHAERVVGEIISFSRMLVILTRSRFCQWDSVENAQRFAASDNLREVMMEAGVIGRPEIHFLNKV